jgi:hypothetical protein
MVITCHDASSRDEVAYPWATSGAVTQGALTGSEHAVCLIVVG